MTALLRVLAEYLTDILSAGRSEGDYAVASSQTTSFVKSRQELLASEFRRRMTEMPKGSSFATATTNSYREGFYKTVMSRAEEVKFRVLHVVS